MRGDAFTPVPNRGMITMSIMLANIMQGVDNTILNVALPHIQGSLSASLDQIAWALTSYIVCAAIMMPLTGWLAGRFGIKYIFLVSVIGFTLASALCGAAGSLGELVFFRALQGVAGAGLIPLSQATLLQINPPQRHGHAMAVFGIGTIMGPIMGPALGGWVTEDSAKRVVTLAGFDLDALRAAAEKRDFKPVVLGTSLSMQLTCQIREGETGNVFGMLDGTDPQLKKEVVIYMAHHDHLGLAAQRNAEGDNIYNGADDNASGCGVVLEIAHAYGTAAQRPRRSILFASVTAEEQGLLGSEYLGKHPPIPAGKIALDLNYDDIPPLGSPEEVEVSGSERTTFYPTVQALAQEFRLAIRPDSHPEAGHYYRSDHFSLAKVGIPAFSIEAGQDIIGKPPGWGKAQSADYREHRYHQRSDQFDPNWDWSEGVQMAQLGYWLGWEAAQASTMPIWLPGDEFRAAREKSLRSVAK
jgi:hypothetical protein